MRRKETVKLAKLTRPRLHAALPRKRLFARLDEARKQRGGLVIISPPGAGKTSLLASWLTTRKLHYIWYQVDAGDTDLATFFYYLGQAAAAYQRKGQPTLPLLTPEYLPNVTGFARRYFRELFARLPTGAALVLDNYQDVPAHQPFHSFIAEAINEIPPGITLIAISRRDPPDCYARLIANEHVGIIEWDEIKLTREEAKAISAKRAALTEQQFDSLFNASGGWAAGLTLMLERLKRNGIAPERAQSETREDVFNYFANVIFERLPETTQHILLTTAMLPSVSAPSAQQISGINTAGELLEQLYRQRLFTDRRQIQIDRRVSIDQSEREQVTELSYVVYQYHPLFREFLLAKAVGTFAEAERAELHRHAARLLVLSGEPDEAIALYVEAREWRALVQLIETQAPLLMGQGRWQTLQEWIQVLPSKEVGASAALQYWYGSAEINREPGAAHGHLERALTLYQEGGDALGQLRAIVGILSAHFVQDSDLARYAQWVEPMSRLLRQGIHWPADAVELEVLAMFLFVASHQDVKHPLVPQVCARVLTLLDQPSIDTNTRAAAALRALIYLLWHGEVAWTRRVDAILEALCSDANTLPVHIAMAHAFRGCYQSLTVGNLRAAIEHTQRAQAIIERHGLSGLNNLIDQFQAVFGGKFADDLALSEAALRRIQTRGVQGNLNRETHFHAMRAHLANWRGDIASGCDHARRALAAARADCPVFLILTASGCTHLLVDGGAFDEARALIAEVRELVRGSFYDNFASALMLHEAYIALREVDAAASHDLLRQGLRGARLHPRHEAVLHHSGALLSRLFGEALAHDIEADYVRGLIRRWKLLPQPGAQQTWPWQVSVQTLGKFAVLVNGAQPAFGRKVPRKVLDLLKALIAFGGYHVAIDRIQDALWPDLDADAARKACATSLYRLRKLLCDADVLVLQNDVLGFDPNRVWVDALTLDGMSPHGEMSAAELTSIAALYAGSFLAGDSPQTWSVSMRERLRRKFVQSCALNGRRLETARHWDDALAVYARAIETDDLAEEFYQGQMRCYLATQRNAEAAAVFRRLRQRLSVTLAIDPAPVTQELFRKARAGERSLEV